MDEIQEMSHPLRLATMAVITSVEDPKFDIDTWLKREQFFEGYAKEKASYKKRKLGYKKPTETDIIQRVSKLGLSAEQMANILKKEPPKEPEPIPEVVEQVPELTPVRGVQRMGERPVNPQIAKFFNM